MSVGVVNFPIPDLPVGKLVETPPSSRGWHRPTSTNRS